MKGLEIHNYRQFSLGINAQRAAARNKTGGHRPVGRSPSGGTHRLQRRVWQGAALLKTLSLSFLQRYNFSPQSNSLLKEKKEVKVMQIEGFMSNHS